MRKFGCDGCLMVGYLDRAPCYISWMVGYMGWIWDRLWDGWIYGPAEAYWLDGWIYRLDIWDGCGIDCGMIVDIRAVGTWPAEALTNQTHWRPPR